MKSKLKRLRPFAIGNRLALGIDVSDGAVRGVLMNVRKEPPSALRWSEVPIRKGDRDSGQAPWAAALKKFFKEFSLTGVRVSISLPPADYFISRYEFPGIPAQKVGEGILKRLEEERFSFSLEEATISYAEVPKAAKGTFVVACVEKGKIAPVFSALHHAGAVDFDLLPANVSIHNCLPAEEKDEEEEGADPAASAVLNLGRGESVLTFFDRKGFLLRRVIPIGRDDFRRNMASSGLLSPKDEKDDERFAALLGECPLETVFKREEDRDLPREKKKILESVLPVLGRLASSIRKTFHFCDTRITKDPTKILYLTGDFRGLTGIDGFFKRRLNVAVRFLDPIGSHAPPEKIEKKKESAGERARFAEALGNALEERGDLSLVPKEELFLPRLRMLRAVVRVTAAVLLLGMILLTVFYTFGFKKLENAARISEAVTSRLEAMRGMEKAVLMQKEQDLHGKTVVQGIVPPAGLLTATMKELSRLIPPFVSLDRLEIDSNGKTASLSMKGIFSLKDGDGADGSRSRFVNELEASPLLDNLSIHSQEWRKRGKSLISKFDISAHLITGPKPGGGQEK